MYWLPLAPALAAAAVVLVAALVVLVWPRPPGGQHRSPAPAGSSVWQVIEQVEAECREQRRRAEAECTGRHHLRPAAPSPPSPRAARQPATPQTRSCAVTPTRAGPPGGRVGPLPPGHRIHRNPCREEFLRAG